MPKNAIVDPSPLQWGHAANGVEIEDGQGFHGVFFGLQWGHAANGVEILLRSSAFGL